MLSKSTRITTAGTLALCAVLSCSAGNASAMWGAMDDVPVSRLVENLTKFTKANPNDADAFYRLGRVHSLAFSLNTNKLAAIEKGMRDGKPLVTDHGNPPAKHESLTEEQRREHLVAAVRNFNHAIALNPRVAQYYLGLASVLEAGSAFAGSVEIIPIDNPVANPAGLEAIKKSLKNIGRGNSNPDGLRTMLRRAVRDGEAFDDSRQTVALALLHHWNIEAEDQRALVRQLLKEDWEEQTTEAYFVAMSLRLPADSKAEEQSPDGIRSSVSHEAATCYLRIVKARGVRSDEVTRVKIAEAILAAYNEMPSRSWVTPIIFSTSARHSSIDNLLSPHVTTKFDLDGTGRGTTWPWVKNDTGIMVWDPKSEGKITSGRQLFGSVTWWVFFKDGYEALDALDDNRDGELTGDELAGLAVWTDRNGNGISDPGEVQPVKDAGIAAIACRATGVDGKSPCNALGLRMSDGRVLPTYDWTTAPVKVDKIGAFKPIGVTAVAMLAFGAFGFVSRRKQR